MWFEWNPALARWRMAERVQHPNDLPDLAP